MAKELRAAGGAMESACEAVTSAMECEPPAQKHRAWGQQRYLGPSEPACRALRPSSLLPRLLLFTTSSMILEPASPQNTAGSLLISPHP